jgi:hypothetical protein
MQQGASDTQILSRKRVVVVGAVERGTTGGKHCYDVGYACAERPSGKLNGLYSATAVVHARKLGAQHMFHIEQWTDCHVHST